MGLVRPGPLVPDDLWAAIEPLLPAARPKPKGGRPPIPDRAALHRVLLERLYGAGQIDWRRAALDSASVPAQRGRAHRAEPDRPRRRPDELYAGKAHDHRRCRQECHARGITPRIARRGMESREPLGRRRWAVERTLAWLARFLRRLTIRYGRRAVVRLNQIRRFR